MANSRRDWKTSDVSLLQIPFPKMYLHITNSIGVVMVNMLASSAVDRGFESKSGQTKDYTIGIACFSVKHAALRRKSEDWKICCLVGVKQQSLTHDLFIEYKLTNSQGLELG